MTPVAADRPERAATAAAASAPRLGVAPFLVVVAAAAAFAAPYLRPGSVLLPTGLHTIPPWIGEAGNPGDRPTNELMADALVITLPSRAWNHESLRAGELPFWNPRIYGGYPHLAMIQSNALYPPSALLDLIDPAWSMGASIFLHLAVAGALMLVFLRAIGLSAAAALVGAVAFELNGFFLVRASAPSYVFSGTWLPLVLLGTRAVAHGLGPRAGLALAIGTALTVLGGHPQIASLSLAAATAYLPWEIAGARPPGSPRRISGAVRSVVWFALLVALGVGLVGFQVVPFAELLRESSRQVVPLGAVLASALPLPGLLQALLPDAFGHPVDGTYWFADLAHLLDGHARSERAWTFNYSGGNAFTGIAPLVLAAIAIARPTRDAVFFALLALASLGILVGPLLGAAYYLVPGFARSRPDRVLFLYMAAVPVLAGLGFEALRGDASREPASRLAAGALRLALLAAVATAALHLLDAARRDGLGEWLAQGWERAAALPVSVPRQALVAGAIAAACGGLAAATRRGVLGPNVAAAVFVVAIAVPNLAFGWRFNPVQPAPRLGTTATERAIVARAGGGRIARLLDRGGPVLPANVLQLAGVDDVHGASAAGLERYLALVSAADLRAVAKMKYFPAFRDPAVLSTHLLDVLGAGLLVSDREPPPPWRAVVAEDGVTVFENPDAPAPFRLVRDVEVIEDPGRARRRVAEASFDPGRSAVVGPRGGGDARAQREAIAGVVAAFAGAPPAATAGEVRVVRRTAHEIDLLASSPAVAVLVTSEVDYPGWESEVDGRPVPTLLVNAAFRGVAVPPGEHRVRMRYVARSFWIGVAASITAAVALMAIARRAPGRGAGR